MTESTQAPPPLPPATTGWTSPATAAPAGQGFNLHDFLYFRYMITPPSVTVVYIFGVVGITFAAFATMLGGNLLVGLAILTFGNLYWRIVLEFVMVLFRMNDSLQSIDRRGKRGM